MEITASSLVSLAAMVAAIVGSAAVAQYKINSIAEQIGKLSKKLHASDIRQDALEANRAVSTNQLKVITSILSPDALKKQSERDGAIEERLKFLEREVAAQRHLHNSKHPPTQS